MKQTKQSVLSRDTIWARFPPSPSSCSTSLRSYLAVLFCPPCNYSHSFDIKIWKYSERSVCNKAFVLLYVSLTLTDLCVCVCVCTCLCACVWNSLSRDLIHEESRKQMHTVLHINATLTVHRAAIKHWQRHLCVRCTTCIVTIKYEY